MYMYYVHVFIGSVKVWDFSTGQQLKSFMPPESHVDVPVPFLQYLVNDSQRTLLAVYSNQSAIHLLVSYFYFDLYNLLIMY